LANYVRQAVANTPEMKKEIGELKTDAREHQWIETLYPDPPAQDYLLLG
jgi:hypothetical protein